jgi:ABC-type Fe3+ transport system substrate-binding protein
MSRRSRRAFLRLAILGAGACVFGTALPAAEAQTPATDWLLTWEEVIGAARLEGRLSLITVVGRGYQAAIDAFQQTFPGIEVEHLAESTSAVWLQQARASSPQRFDLALVSAEAALPEDLLWAPVKPLLFRPDVVADDVWRDGAVERYMDVGASLCFGWEFQVIHAYAINTDLVAKDEITQVEDLLDPKWRGAILSSDPRIGTGLLSAASVAHSLGPDALRHLLIDQRPTFSHGMGNRITEWLVRGRYPIALGVRPKALNPFREQGLGHNVQYLDLPQADFVATGSLLHFDGAPHPAAAALFANWILTHEAQTILTRTLGTNSVRVDVEPFEPDGVGAAGVRYYEPSREVNAAHIAATRQFVNSLSGIRLRA